jgi:hypothetical protein
MLAPETRGVVGTGVMFVARSIHRRAGSFHARQVTEVLGLHEQVVATECPAA